MRKLLIIIPLAAMAVVIGDRALCRYRPVRVPPALAREIIQMETEGWTAPRWPAVSAARTPT